MSHELVTTEDNGLAVIEATARTAMRLATMRKPHGTTKTSSFIATFKTLSKTMPKIIAGRSQRRNVSTAM